MRRRIKTHLEPLAIAANVAQASHTRLDHVLLMLANLFRLYDSLELDADTEIRSHMTKSLEKRWKAADQIIFILALFFNPYIRAKLFNSEACSLGDIIDMAKRTFTRLFQVEPTFEFTSGIIEYARAEGAFSNDRMGLDDRRQEAEAASKVSSL